MTTVVGLEAKQRRGTHTTFSHRIDFDHFFFVHYAAVANDYVQWICLSGCIKVRSSAKSGHSLVAVLLEYYNLITGGFFLYCFF